MADGLFAGAVGADRQGAAAGGDDALHQRFGGLRRLAVAEGDAGAVTGQALGDGGADAARTALDESNFAAEGKVSGHVRLRGIGVVDGNEYLPSIDH
ncbi:hypothetical protein D3C84_1069690 [compost metagenome]